MIMILSGAYIFTYPTSDPNIFVAKSIFASSYHVSEHNLRELFFTAELATRARPRCDLVICLWDLWIRTWGVLSNTIKMKAASEIFSEGYIFVLQSKSSSLTDLRGSGTTHAAMWQSHPLPCPVLFLGNWRAWLFPLIKVCFAASCPLFTELYQRPDSMWGLRATVVSQRYDPSGSENMKTQCFHLETKTLEFV